MPMMPTPRHLIVALGLGLCAALAKVDSGDPFYRAKLATARFYFAKLLPETAMLIRTARAGAKPMMDVEEALF